MILNYTTKIKPEKTAGEIQQMLGKSGASAVMSEYVEGEVSAIAFQLPFNGQILSFRLPINADGVFTCLVNECPKSYQSIEQAKRTAWRIIKDWVEAQLALVEAHQAVMVEVFLPYLQDSNGSTVYQKLSSDGFLALGYDK